MITPQPEYALLAAIAAGLPEMPLAACRSLAPLFDSFGREASAVPLRVCQHCPELEPCRAWSLSLTAESRPTGVLGGEVVYGHRSKKRLNRLCGSGFGFARWLVRQHLPF